MRNLNKRDLVTIMSIWVIFFLMASFNLGLHEIPKSGWKVSGDDGFYIDLNGEKNVSEILLFLRDGKINLDIFTGQPGNWTYIKTSSINDYYKWKRIDIKQSNRFLKIEFKQSLGEILEIVFIADGHRVENFSIYRENSQEDSLLSLIDEQEMVVLPITYKSETIFDEVYYVRAAEEYLSEQEPYENTHPPLGKLIIAFGISIFGFNPYGWRIMGVLFASSMLPIMYFLGKKISGSWLGGFISSFLLMFDFMHFTMSRLATIDTFLVFFLLSSQLFFYNYFLDVIKTGWSASLRPYFLAVFMLALGFSIKWTAMFSFAGNIFYLGFLRFYTTLKNAENKSEYILSYRKIIYAISGTVAIFGSVYLLCYVPYMTLGHSLKDVYNSQWFMLDYHSKLTADHSFSSPWWSWPLLIKPVWLYFSDLGEELVSTITLMGNPSVWWVGLVSIITISKKAIKEKNPSYVYLIMIFFFQWIPYAIISRALFIYHFYPNLLILCLSTSKICAFRNVRKEIWKVVIFILVLVTLFGLFYPVISGSIITVWWRDSLKWLPSWVF